MSFLERAIKNGISKGMSSAIGNAVKQAVEPKATAYANKVAERLEQAAQNLEQQTQQAAQKIEQQTQQAAQQTLKTSNGLESAFVNLRQSVESYATLAAKNIKICPICQTPATTDKKFCPSCGARLPEESLAEGTVCLNCGRQNPIGTKFCQDCGAKLPFALAEEKEQDDRDAAVLASWTEMLPEYPVWTCGGKNFTLEQGEEYFRFNAVMESPSAAEKAVEDYRMLLKQNGFKEAGQYPDIKHLYKKIGEQCYHVDTEHCFEGDLESPDICFDTEEPCGGYDYVKPVQQKKSGWLDLFNT